MRKIKNIGFITDNISSTYQILFWLTAKRKAEEYNCNLICFEGGRFDSVFNSEIQHAVLFKLANEQLLDGLILISNPLIDFTKSVDTLTDFCKQFSSIPIVSIGLEVPETTSVLVDNKTGMKEVVSHMVKDHGYKKVGFLKGPDSNPEANERLQAYLEVLKENGLPVNEEYIFSGMFNVESGNKATENILLNNINLDALVCANDEMAIGALRALENLDMDTSLRFKLSGFDDTPNECDLTTVRQPTEEMVSFAFEVLLKDRGKKNENANFPARLVKRSSCGCSPEAEDKEKINRQVMEDILSRNRFIEFIQTSSYDKLFEVITDVLPMINAKSCFIVKYQDGPVEYSNLEEVPKISELIYAYYNFDEIKLSDNHRHFKTSGLLPDKFMTGDRFTYLIQPLYYNTEHFGYIIFDVINNDVTNYTLLSVQISNAMKIISMALEMEKFKDCSEKTQKLASLGEMARELSQSINNPTKEVETCLRSLKNDINKLFDTNLSQEMKNELQSAISNSLDKVREQNKMISNNAVSFRKQTLNIIMDSVEEFDIQTVLNDLILLNHNTENKVVINNSFTKKLNTDRNKLSYIISNLIQNSIDGYKGNGGNVEISAEECNGNLVIEVKDFACGIPDEIKDKIFNKFFITTDYSTGTGIGLYVSNILIKQYFSGEISFETEAGKGTLFCITIPLNKI